MAIVNTGWFKPGQSGNPRGRPPKPVSASVRVQRKLAELPDGMITPLEFLLALIRKDVAMLTALDVSLKDVDLGIRKAAADSLLPYLHRRQPTEVAMAVVEFSQEDVAALSMLSDEEFEAVHRVMRRIETIKQSLGFETPDEGGASDSPSSTRVSEEQCE